MVISWVSCNMRWTCFSACPCPCQVSWLPYSTDSYFHDLVFVFVSYIPNIKAANMKSTAGKSANVRWGQHLMKSPVTAQTGKLFFPPSRQTTLPSPTTSPSRAWTPWSPSTSASGCSTEWSSTGCPPYLVCPTYGMAGSRWAQASFGFSSRTQMPRFANNSILSLRLDIWSLLLGVC